MFQNIVGYCSDFSWSHPLCCLDHPTPSCSHPRHTAALAAWNTSIGAAPVHSPAELSPWPCPGSSGCPSPLLWPCLFIVAIAQSSSQTSRLSVEREVVHCHEGILFSFFFSFFFVFVLLVVYYGQAQYNAVFVFSPSSLSAIAVKKTFMCEGVKCLNKEAMVWGLTRAERPPWTVALEGWDGLNWR